MALGIVQKGMKAANWDNVIGMHIVLHLRAEKPICFEGKQAFLLHHSRNEGSFLNRIEKYNSTDLHNADS